MAVRLVLFTVRRSTLSWLLSLLLVLVQQGAVLHELSHLSHCDPTGGTTLRDYVGADGSPGYFRQRLYVYERTGKPCRNCRTPIRALVQGQRSTYYCPSCQR